MTERFLHNDVLVFQEWLKYFVLFRPSHFASTPQPSGFEYPTLHPWSIYLSISISIFLSNSVGSPVISIFLSNYVGSPVISIFLSNNVGSPVISIFLSNYVGSPVLSVTAKDQDSGEFGTAGLRYQLAGNGAELFSVNPETGLISVAPCSTPGSGACLDYEQTRKFFVTLLNG